ncbi:MAG: M48 family metallopeptidase [Rikenellaceae bacterium]
MLLSKKECDAIAKGSKVNIPHKELESITLFRSTRASRIAVTVSAKGEVRLTIPKNGDVSSALKFLEDKIEWIIAAKERVTERDESRGDELSPLEIATLRFKAIDYLPQRTALLAKKFGFQYGRVTIRVARTKWGSCTGENNLSLNLFLMKLPPHLIDFVILHELCHTIHHNHSPQFHATLDRCLGGREKELIRELKGYKCGYH